MSRPNAATRIAEIDVGPSPAEVALPLFEMKIPSTIYANREYFAARKAIGARDGILKNLRDALSSADGKSVVVKIFHE